VKHLRAFLILTAGVIRVVPIHLVLIRNLNFDEALYQRMLTYETFIHLFY